MTYVARVQYDGGDAGHGRMDAADLGGAIRGLADMVSGAGAIVAGDDTKIRAQVRTDFEGNSFVVVFEIVAFASDLLGSVDSVVSLLGLSENANGLIQILQQIRGRRITAVRQPQEGDPSASMALVIGDDRIEVSVSDMHALRDDKIVKGATSFVKPLLEGRATQVSISNGGDTTAPRGSVVVIPQEEARYLRTPTFSDDKVETQPHEIVVLTVVTPVFDGDYLWRLSWNGNIIMARMEDAEFIRRIRANEVTFGYEDTLQARVETDRVRGKDGGPLYRHRIVKVLDHKKRERHVTGDLFPPQRPT